MPQTTIAFFPEAAYGPALNSVAIAQAVQALGLRPVFLSDPGFVEFYQGYGFEAHPVCLSAPMPPEQMARFWEDFIKGQIPNFPKSPYEQIDNYVKDCWSAIVDSAKWAQKDLPAVLARVLPDLVCVDNVILFPAIKQYGRPWVRIISCSENVSGSTATIGPMRNWRESWLPACVIQYFALVLSASARICGPETARPKRRTCSRKFWVRRTMRNTATLACGARSGA